VIILKLRIIGLALLIVIIGLMIFPTAAMAAPTSEILTIGDRSESVRELQVELKEKGYLSCTATGYYGTLTQAAVMQFQKDKGLKVDGKAGPMTKGALFGSGDIKVTKEPSTSVESDKDKYVVGDRGDEVLAIQKRLKALEYYDYNTATGYYGPVTKTAVERFQKTNKLMVDGVVGKVTHAKLFSDSAKYFTLYPKDRGDDVTNMQEKLKTLGYYSYSKITGYYGSITLSAVRDFQKANGLVADGVAGRNTRKLLYSGSVAQNPVDSGDNTVVNTPQSGSKADSLIDFAKTLLGKPYVLSSEGPNSFDCSGFIYYVMKNSGLSVSRYSAAVYSMQESWEKVTRISDLEKGDMMFFRSSYSPSITHTGMYIGDGKLIHASSSKRAITISNVSGYFTDNFSHARRVLK
jgi:peptidoglycan hydrolase-like protein with peptidoglycan-binding domain